MTWEGSEAQMLGQWGNGNGSGSVNGHHVVARQNNGQPDTSAFNIVNGRIFTPGLGIILAVSLKSHHRHNKQNRKTN